MAQFGNLCEVIGAQAQVEAVLVAKQHRLAESQAQWYMATVPRAKFPTPPNSTPATP